MVFGDRACFENIFVHLWTFYANGRLSLSRRRLNVYETIRDVTISSGFELYAFLQIPSESF